MKRLQYRIATAAEFTSKNPILAKDEIGIERDTGKEKIGDGTSQWSALSYFADSATDSTKVLKTGDTMTGNLNMGTSYRITNLADGSAATDAATKGQVDTVATAAAAAQTTANNALPKAGGTMTGDLNMSGTQKVINLANGSASGDAINKGQLDAVAATAGAALPKPGSSTDNAIVRWDGTSGSAVQNSAVTISDDTTLVGPKEIVIRAEGDPADGGGGSIRTAGSRYTLVLKPRNADATYATASEFYYDSTYVGWWSESKMGCGGDFTVNASAFVNGTASADPVLRVDAVDGRTPYLTLRSQGANDVYMGWIRGNTTRFYFRCTQDTWSIRSADDSGNIWGSAPYGTVFHIDRTNSRVTLGGHTTGKYEAGLEFGTSGPREMVGTGSPEGAVTAPAGSVWRQTDHATFGYVRWIKGSGTGNTGWLLSPEGRIWCEGRRTSNQSISDVTSTVITYTAETDRWNMLNTGTGKITLPVAGLWGFSAQISWATDFANWQHASILNETASVTVASLRTASGPYQVSLSGVLSCAANDVMSVSVFQDSTGAQNVGYARFNATLVGT